MIIDLVETRSNGKKFERIEDVVRPEELAAISEKYKQIAGYDLHATQARFRAQKSNLPRTAIVVNYLNVGCAEIFEPPHGEMKIRLRPTKRYLESQR